MANVSRCLQEEIAEPAAASGVTALCDAGLHFLTREQSFRGRTQHTVLRGAMAISTDLLILGQNSRFSAFINPSCPKPLLAASVGALQLWLAPSSPSSHRR